MLSAHEWAILARIVGLSSREAVVFALIGEGHRPKVVAGLLDSSVKTVETHIERIRSRLGGARGPVQGDDLVFLARIWARSRKA